MTSEVVKPAAPVGEVTLTIDGVEVTAPKGELLIRTAERYGIEIPRFCDHPLLEPAGACRQCLVEVEGQRKPVASCTQTVADGMVVRTQLTSGVAKKAQEGIMELLLINHPLDCPMCDKGGECPLQNQAMSTGRTDTRFVEQKREYPKPINISSQVLLDRERCVLCQRCTRFSDEIAGDKFIDLMDRSSAEQINVYGARSTTATTRGTCRSTRTSPVTPCRSAPWALSPARSTGSARAPSTWCRRRVSATTAEARCCAASPVRTLRSTKSGTATRAAGVSSMRTRSTG